MTLRIEHPGTERHPVVIIDDAIANAEELVAIAASQSFAPTAPYYPGVRTPAPDDYLRAVAAGLAPLLADVFGLEPSSISVESGDFSLVTKTPSNLKIIQRLPHYDGTDPGTIALLHFLCGEENGGTSFYRHRATGFELVDDVRFDAYRRVLESEVKESCPPPAAYVGGSTPLFERTAHYGAKFNRMLIYGGAMLHSGDVPTNLPLSDDPRKGRLTVNTFLAARRRGAIGPEPA